MQRNRYAVHHEIRSPDRTWRPTFQHFETLKGAKQYQAKLEPITTEFRNFARVEL